jgi:uncharacterized membrane protein YphA (DoxX/SURF4 family)
MGQSPSEPIVVGVNPWLPWPLSACRWWTEPVRAERLAALRIALAAILAIDLFCTYRPSLHDFYGGNSLGEPAMFKYRFEVPRWNWSYLRGERDPAAFDWALAVWGGATLCLLAGLCTRLSVVVVWVLSTSFANVNPYNDNAGDQIRTIALFYLMLCPCGAAWSVDAWLRRRWGGGRGLLARWLGRPPGPVYVSPWALRLLFIQMTYIYFFNGLYKMLGEEWREGDSLYLVLNDLTLARWSYAQLPLPVPLTRLLTWSVMVWEVLFPLLMIVPWLFEAPCRRLGLNTRLTRGIAQGLRLVRISALLFGVAFHLGIFLSLEIGGFGPYMISLYAPLLPWERWIGRRTPAESMSPPTVSAAGPE